MAGRTRVERWAEDSGNAGLAGRELPPAEVLAAGQRVTAWARQLRKAGLEGGMDALRARAFMDLLLGTDSRPLGSGPDGTGGPRGSEGSGPDGSEGSGPDGSEGSGPDGSEGSGPDGAGHANPGGSCGSGGSSGPGPGGPGPHEPRTPAPAGPPAGVIPPGFAGRVTLTIPPTLTDLASRPGELAGIGPIDPKPKANTSDCYRSQVRADPARAAQPRRLDLPHP